MCGILGYAGRTASDAEAMVRAAIHTLDHRGPDSNDVQTFRAAGASCVLGHTRLRIIDLSSDADQPMTNEDRTIWVTYNGELYNYRELRADLERGGHAFRAHTDTEVLVHLYEEYEGDVERMLRSLRGMFAFSLFDLKRGRVVLARDRYGIKPMYWAPYAGGIAFASEARTLVRAGFASAAADPLGLSSYLLWGHVAGSHTIFEGVQSLAAGSYLTWSPDRFEIRRWWDLAENLNGRERNADRSDLAAALDDSVARHLIADRPVGIFLSGGVDSSAIATLARAHGAARALTVTFPEVGGDEGEAANVLAKQLEIDHVQVPVTGKELAEALPGILSAMDQPTSDGVNTWLVSKAAREAGLVVALSGLGGDELFGGYPTFRLVPRVERLMRLVDLVPWRVRAPASRSLSRRGPGGRFARLLGSASGYEGAYLAVRGLFSPAEVDSPGSNLLPFEGSERFRSASPEDRVTMLEASRYMSDQLLRDTDQMSMSHSLEVRVPLLDDLVSTTALALPSEIRTSPGKAALAEAAGLTRLPAKQPFALPFDEWMRGPLKETVREGLLSDALPLADLVDDGFCKRLWSAFEDRKVHWSRPWAVAVIRMWPAANGLRW